MIGRRVFTDLDNTVIFSHRHEIGERVLVESLNGKPQAYMTKSGYARLQETDPEEFVPVTSRTLEQYRRIQFYSDGRQPKYALIDNGGLLLIDGEIDETWRDETKRMIAEDMEKLKELENSLPEEVQLKWQDEMVLFIKTKKPFDEIAGLAEKSGLMVFNHLNKIYVCSDKLTKGKAVRRFREKFPAEYSVAAGDTEVDTSMISEVDEGYYALSLKDKMMDRENVHFVNTIDIARLVFGG